MDRSKRDRSGTAVVYAVPIKQPFIIPEEIDENCLFILESVSLVEYNGVDKRCAAWPEKEFVHSFDKKREQDFLITMWASRNPASEARIKIKAEINLKTKEINVTGSGFECVFIHMYRTKEQLSE